MAMTFNLSQSWQHDHYLHSFGVTYAKKLDCTYPNELGQSLLCKRAGRAYANKLERFWLCLGTPTKFDNPCHANEL